MAPSRGGTIVRRGRWSLVVEIVAAVAAIWVLGLLSLLFTLPAEFIAPSDPVADGAIEPDSVPQRAA
jgi:hypothetical protein